MRSSCNAGIGWSWHASAFGKLRKKKEDGIVEEGLEFADDSYINEDEENAEESAEITKNHKVWRKGSSLWDCLFDRNRRKIWRNF